MKILLILVLIAIVGLAIVFGVSAIDGNRFVIQYHTIEDEKLRKSGRFLFLSDLHNHSFGEKNGKLLQKIEELHPDGIFLAGDIFTAKPGKSFQVAVDFLTALAEKYPIYYGMGNHETRTTLYPDVYGDMWERYRKELEKIGIVPMRNLSQCIEEYGIRVTGLEIDRSFYKRFSHHTMGASYIDQEVGKVQKEYFQVLLAHNPEYFSAYSEWGADLVLSGHVHGGVVRLPFLGGVISPSLKLFPKYDGGVFYEKNAMMILSRGLGMHTLPIRFLNPGELIVLDFCGKNR